jgi:IS4 transposase
MDYVLIKENEVENRGISWVQRDQVIEIFNPMGRPYRWHLRLIHYISPDDGNEYHFLTNNFEITAETVALFYKNRRKIELFFKFIKQHLKIKSFLW